MTRVIILILIFQVSFSQTEQKRVLGDFNEIKVYDGINVFLKKSNRNFLEVSCENTQNVVVINRSGTIKLKMNLLKKFQGENTVVNIEHKEPVFLIESQQGSKIIVRDTIDSSTIYFKTSSGGQINAQIKVKKVRSTSASGGVIKLTGSTSSHEAKAISGGIINASKVISAQTKVNTSSGGFCNAFGKEVFEATASFGGVINVYGSPNALTQSSSFGGQIIEKQSNE